MTRVLFDSRGRRWLSSQGGIGAAADARNFRPGADEIAPGGLPILHCECGDMRVALPMPATWRDLPDDELQSRLEDKLRERGL